MTAPTIEPCPLTELPPSMCAHCRGLTSPEEQAAATRKRLLNGAEPGWIEAQYPGTCGTCGERFQPGAAIRMHTFSGEWRADCCAEVGR